MPTAREAFPTGLIQPEDGYRFSMDPLLLAAFARPKKDTRLADLGTGCGVAALAALLMHSQTGAATGLDIDPAMIEAANANAHRLGLDGRFHARLADVRHMREILPPESFRLVLANPPYRRLGTGKACQLTERNRARFEAHAELDDFLAAASWLLANRGSVVLVFPAARLSDLVLGCQKGKLAPKRLRFVHSRVDEAAKIVLMEAVKNAGIGLTAEPPLILYEGRGDNTRLTAQALSFCPFLAKNP
jgi:tRNA1Val (adenine37-N6)-methyltransferase